MASFLNFPYNTQNYNKMNTAGFAQLKKEKKKGNQPKVIITGTLGVYKITGNILPIIIDYGR